MKNWKKWLFRFVLIHSPLFIIWPMASWDYHKVASGQKPTFARYSGGYSDGGTLVWTGLGYQVEQRRRLHTPDNEPWGYMVGPYRYIYVLAAYPWFWSFLGSGQLHFEADPNLKSRSDKWKEVSPNHVQQGTR
jgi:hypothetical protein